MEKYNLMAIEWDFENDSKKVIPQLTKKGVHTPLDYLPIMDKCGFFGIMDEEDAIEYAKKQKKKFPYAKFILAKGETWGTLKLVQEL